MNQVLAQLIKYAIRTWGTLLRLLVLVIVVAAVYVGVAVALRP
jgi:hypothetical protein